MEVQDVIKGKTYLIFVLNSESHVAIYVGENYFKSFSNKSQYIHTDYITNIKNI